MALALTKALGTPIISTSASYRGEETLNDPAEIVQRFKGIELVLDAGYCGVVSSTVVDLTGYRACDRARGSGARGWSHLSEAVSKQETASAPIACSRPKGALPQAAERVDNDFTRCFDTEILLDVDTLNLDAASFRQMLEASAGTHKVSQSWCAKPCRRAASSTIRSPARVACCWAPSRAWNKTTS